MTNKIVLVQNVSLVEVKTFFFLFFKWDGLYLNFYRIYLNSIHRQLIISSPIQVKFKDFINCDINA